MNDLSKQQLILLALLVSFVTSLATGIFTVSLMEQAPRGVVSVINQVVERTVEKASSQEAATVEPIITPEERLTEAIDRVSESIVKIINRNDKVVSGIGLVVSENGVILIDKSAIASIDAYDVVLSDGTVIPVSLIQSQVDGDIAFLAPTVKLSPLPAFAPISYSSSQKLGQSVLSLSGTSTLTLAQGLVTRAASPESASVSESALQTSIPNSAVIVGSPAFNQAGEVIGIKTFSVSENPTANFFPLSKIRGIIPSI